jgi:hypothetical protein
VDELLLQADRLLSVDLIDRAEQLYAQVAQQDPMDASAVVGLARCELARGHDPEAYRLAARAHAIDPGHDMARRMELRLAEVLAARGESLAPRPEHVGPPPERSGRRSLVERLLGR